MRTKGTTLVELNSLLWHEQFNAQHVAQIAELIRYEQLREPIHVDADHGVILDGAHRAAAFIALGRPQIPAHLVRVPEGVQIPGWFYRTRASSWPAEFESRKGPTVAIAHGPDRRYFLRSCSAAPQDVSSAYHEVARCTGYRDSVRSAYADDASDVTLEWVVPEWVDLVTMIKEVGPLPTSVSRMRPIFEEFCASCGTS